MNNLYAIKREQSAGFKNRNKQADRNFERVEWVIKARAVDSIRKNICAINIQSGKIIATDGHRLHWAKIPYEIPDGVYNIISHQNLKIIILEKAEDQIYPDWEKVCVANSVPKYQGTNASSEPVMMIYDICKNAPFNVKFIQDAFVKYVSLDIKVYYENMSNYSKPLPVLIISEIVNDEVLRQVVVMGLNL